MKLIVGIASYEEMKARTLAIAKGEYVPKKGEPKVWFTSITSFSRILSEHNRELLQIIGDHQPQGYKELEALSGRKKSSLSRTLKKMEHYGFIKLEKLPDRKIAPQVIYSDIELRLPLHVMASP